MNESLSRTDFLEAGIRIERRDGLIYVYMDTPEAVQLAPQFLPKTQRGVAPDGSEVWVYRDPEPGDPGQEWDGG